MTFDATTDINLQSILKTKLKSKTFIGYFKEKRLCDALKSYRDIVTVDPKEKEFMIDLDYFLLELTGRTQAFVGVSKSSPEDNYTIWTELEFEPQGKKLGRYWFQVKSIKFRFNEIQIKLKTLRAIDDDSKTFVEKLSATTNNPANELTDVTEQWKALYEFWKREIAAAVAWLLSITINRQTIIETLRFVSLLIVSLFAGSTQIVKYVGIFAIKLIERTTWLVHVLTPYALGLLDLLSKIIGGFYLLIAMIWKDSIGAPRRQPPSNAIGYGSQQRRPQAIQ